MVSLDVSHKWANPKAGRIPPPAPDDIVCRRTTSFLTILTWILQEFRFQNSWGASWGDGGYGYVSQDTLEKIWWEAWKHIFNPVEVTPPRDAFPHPRAWCFKDVDGSRLHWLELVDRQENRLAWVSARESNGALEIEELFVRPQCRRQGHGRNLLKTIVALAQSKGLDFRIWVSFADAAPTELNRIEALIRPFALSIQTSAVRWAPLVIVPVWTRRTEPLQTFEYPSHPPSSPSQIAKIAADVAMQLGTGVVAAFLYDALKSWLRRDSGKRIRAKVGDVEIETSEISTDEFLKLAKGLQDLRTEAEIMSKLLEAKINVTIVNKQRK